VPRNTRRAQLTVVRDQPEMAPADRVGQIIEHERLAEELQAQSDQHRWEAARLIAAELADGKSQRQLSQEIGKSQTHVSFAAKTWELYGGDYLGNRLRLTWNDAYHGPAVRSKRNDEPDPESVIERQADRYNRRQHGTARAPVVRLNGKQDEYGPACDRVPGVVYIGHELHRQGWNLTESPWANPNKEGRDGTRAEIIEKYREHLMSSPDLLARLPDLKGKTLACWCKPKPCHGDVLVELIEAENVTPRRPDLSLVPEPEEQPRPGPGIATPAVIDGYVNRAIMQIDNAIEVAAYANFGGHEGDVLARVEYLRTCIDRLVASITGRY